MRKLKHVEKKLLKKVDFMHYKRESNFRELTVMRRYHIQDRNDYVYYNRLVGKISKLVNKLIEDLKPNDPVRIKMTDQLLKKLYDMGLIRTNQTNLEEVYKAAIKVSAFCRRRLPVVMVRLKFCESVKEATTLIEQGHVRVGPETVTDPAFFVTRAMEDHITWVDSSKIKRHTKAFSGMVDDFELLEA